MWTLREAESHPNLAVGYIFNKRRLKELMGTTLVRCLRVLEALAASERPRGISEFSRELKLDKSAVQRTIQTLANEGYVEQQTGTCNYKTTLKLWELGSLVIFRNEARRLLHPILHYATKTTGLTSYFTWSDYPDILFLDKIEGERGRPSSTEPGLRVPMHIAPSGRAVLAFVDDEFCKAICRAVENQSDFGHEYRARLEADLAAIRQRLYACTEAGSASRINSVASPVWGAAPPVPVGSIVVTSDTATLTTADFKDIGAITTTVAEQATRLLGGLFPSSPADAP